MNRVPSEQSQPFIDHSTTSVDDAMVSDYLSGAIDGNVPLSECCASVDKSNKKKLLIVDYDPVVRHLTRAFLSEEGFRVFTCGDCSRAAVLFSDCNSVDGLIADIEMPHSLGMQLAKLLSSVHPSLSVILTSRVSPDETTLAEIGRNGWQFLTKPFHIPELLSTVRSAFRPSIRATVQPFSSLARFLDDGE